MNLNVVIAEACMFTGLQCIFVQKLVLTGVKESTSIFLHTPFIISNGCSSSEVYVALRTA